MEGELRAIREQMRSDFKTVMQAFAVQRDALTTALEKQEELLAGYMQRTDQRFERLIEIVREIQEWRSTVDDRLDALEKKTAS
jgi:hypothetical protein